MTSRNDDAAKALHAALRDRLWNTLRAVFRWWRWILAVPALIIFLYWWKIILVGLFLLTVFIILPIAIPSTIITLFAFLSKDSWDARLSHPTWWRIFAFVGGKIDAWKYRKDSVGS